MNSRRNVLAQGSASFGDKAADWIGAVMDESTDGLGSARIGSEKRQRLFEDLWQAAVSRIVLLDLTSPTMAARGCRSIVWDAAAMPAGGHYYPIFLRMIERLEFQGKIHPDRTVLVETTTGTAGIALGYVARALGYRVILFMPVDMPARRRDAVAAQLPTGSELHFTAANTYVGGMVKEFQRFMLRNRSLPRDRELYALNHSRHPEAVDALQEIAELAVAKCDCPIDVVVAALGNGTASSALFRAVRSRFSHAERVGVEPLEAPIVYLRKFGPVHFKTDFGMVPRIGPHAMIGTGAWGVSFPNLDIDAIDRVVPVRELTWRSMQRTAKRHGVDMGNSTAACQAAVESIFRDSPRQMTAFSLRYDTTDLY